jgi:hypothetical protein
MSREPLRIANVGAEEQPEALAPPKLAVAERVAALFERLFAGGGAWDWLPGPSVAAAWLNTRAVEAAVRSDGRPLFGAPAEVVERVHDKAFAHDVATREGLVPACLRDCIEVLDPHALRDAATGGSGLDARLDAWPVWAQERFTLKPRFGSSGRGRVAGLSGRLDEPQREGALPRLAARGGAIAEPWLERREDLSVQLLIEPGGGIRLLGSLTLLVDESGLYRGHAGQIDARGRVGSGSRYDEAVRDAAITVALAAAAVGYLGPCGVDAFVFRGPDGEDVLRPVVELNARFTLGTLVLGEVRRALPGVRGAIGLAPDTLRGFHFLLEPGPGEPDDPLAIALGEPEQDAPPRLRFAKTPEAPPVPVGGPPARPRAGAARERSSRRDPPKR